MSDLYYGSAAEAAGDLGLPLLLASSPSAAVPRHGERLSDFAPEVFEGARLYHRLAIASDAPSVAIWVTGPNGTTEYVVWAVGCAEHAARAGRAAYLIDLDPSHPLRSLAPGAGQPPPRSIVENLKRVGVPASGAWATDLQGVRLVLPTAQPIEGTPRQEPGRSILVYAQALPEAGGGEGIPPPAVDGVCFVAAIRDHTREELREAAGWLRNAGHRILGFVAMGPIPAPRNSPLERWERVTSPPPAPELPAPPRAPVSTLSAQDPVPSASTASAPGPTSGGPESLRVPGDSAAGPGERPPAPIAVEPPRAAGLAAETVDQPEMVQPVEPPVQLVADWHRGNRARPGTWLLVLLGLVVALALGTVWLRHTGRSPSDLVSQIRRIGGGAKEPKAPETGGGMKSGVSGGSIPSEKPAAGGRGASDIFEGGPPPLVGPAAPEGGGSESLSFRLGGEGRADSAGTHRAPEVWEQLTPTHPARADSTGATSDSGVSLRPSPVALSPAVPELSPASDSLSTSWPDTFVVHVSSFRRSQEAETEAARLKAAGVPARIVTVILPERGRWHRVVVGAYPDSATASREGAALRAGGLVSFTQTLGSAGRATGRRSVPR